MPEYTLATLLTMIAVVFMELAWARTGIFRTAQYWISLVILFLFQMLVDGWLTKLSAPVVVYNSEKMTCVRFPWDIPIEDFGFGFAMLTFAIVVWKRTTCGSRRDADGTATKETKQER